MGLIERIADEKDRRMVRVFLTEEGERVREISKEQVLKFNRHVQERWGDKRGDAFLEMLVEFNEILDDEDILSHTEIT